MAGRLALLVLAAALPDLGAQTLPEPPPAPPQAKEVRKLPLDEATLRRLLGDLGDDGIEVRDRAMGELVRSYDETLDAVLRDDGRLRELGADLGDPEVKARLDRIRLEGEAILLGREFSEGCRDLLPTLARDILVGTNPRLPHEIGDLLACSHEDRRLALAALSRSLDRGVSPEVERAAVELLDLLVRDGLDAAEGPPLLARTARSGDPKLRERSLEVLASFHEAARDQAPAAEKAVWDPVLPVRLVAIDCLAKIGEPARAAGVFVELLDDERAEVRKAALGGLIGVEARSQLPRLARLAVEDPDPGVRDKARYGLERLSKAREDEAH